jgi:glycosyltransferase involved in cell wall biosynthesis
VIGSLGRLHPNKGYDVLIDALAVLQQRSPELARRAVVRIGGEGPARAALMSKAAERGVTNLELIGFTEPGSFLAGLNCYVQPSHHEGFCIAAHEALQAGLPVIASPVGEMAQSIRASGGGDLVDYGDAAQLATQLEKYIRDPALAHRTGAQAREWILRHFSTEAFATRGLAALRSAGLPVAMNPPA